MAQIYIRIFGAGCLVTTYVIGMANPYLNSNKEKTQDYHDLGEAIALMGASVSGTTGAGMHINLTPNTVVDKQFYNGAADLQVHFSKLNLPIE